MLAKHLEIVVLGLSITSSWGNGHATAYRSLLTGLWRMGHNILFLERDEPWYAEHRDLPDPSFCSVGLYASISDLHRRFRSRVSRADLVLVGSFVPDGVAVGCWALEQARGVVGFYDFDTPTTLAKLGSADHEYITPELVRDYALYFSFSGGPVLRTLARRYGSPMVRPLYGSVDPELYYPDTSHRRYICGYMGTYSPARQAALEELLLVPADRLPEHRFAVVGPRYPDSTVWPPNVERMDHLAPAQHRLFYNSQQFTLNLTRRDMVKAGFSPSVRLFEAAACGVPIITDHWDGLSEFFVPGEEILVSCCCEDTLRHLRDTDDEQRRIIGQRARKRVLERHTSQTRARELLKAVSEVSAHSAQLCGGTS